MWRRRRAGPRPGQLEPCARRFATARPGKRCVDRLGRHHARAGRRTLASAPTGLTDGYSGRRRLRESRSAEATRARPEHLSAQPWREHAHRTSSIEPTSSEPARAVVLCTRRRSSLASQARRRSAASEVAAPRYRSPCSGSWYSSRSSPSWPRTPSRLSADRRHHRPIRGHRVPQSAQEQDPECDAAINLAFISFFYSLS